MNHVVQDQYLRTAVMTAGPEQLQLMLYDGALRFARQGRQALAEGRLEEACDRFIRAQKIVLEMNSSLCYDLDPALCRRLGSLYNYIYRRLVAAGVHRDLAAADEAVGLLEYQRQTWAMVMDKLADQRRGESQGVGQPAPGQSAGPAEPVSVDVAG